MAMMDFALLPPEVNSARMYAGAGSAPMMAAGAAWDQLATMMSSAASSYQAAVSQLTDGPWRGPAAASMAAAANPYVVWMHTTAAQAERAAGQAKAAATAYEEAFVTTVPPPVIAANRALLAALVATNILGQNTAAIAANQAEYAEMWAQDATAMYSYAAGSAAATTLTPFNTPPQTTNPAGIGAQAGAVGQAAAAESTQNTSSVISGMLQALGNPAALLTNSPIIDNPTFVALNDFFGATGPLLSNLSAPLFVSEGIQLFTYPLMLATGKLAMLGGAAAQATAVEAPLAAGLSSSVPEGASGLTLAGSYGPGAAGPADGGVSAGLGRAVPVGALSVPPSWGTASPGIRLAGAALPTAGSVGLAPEAGMAVPGGWFGGPVGSVVNAPRNSEPRVRSGSSFKAIPQIGEENAGDGDTRTPRARPDGSVPAAASTLSQREQAELDGLREEMAELAMECDAMARLMREAMR